MAKLFLPDIAAWLEQALRSLDELDSIQTSNLQTAEKLVSLVAGLKEQFREQRNYLLNQQHTLEDTGMHTKWTGRLVKQAGFVARSTAGARWGLKPSSSRELIRLIKPSERKKCFEEPKNSVESVLVGASRRQKLMQCKQAIFADPGRMLVRGERRSSSSRPITRCFGEKRKLGNSGQLSGSSSSEVTTRVPTVSPVKVKCLCCVAYAFLS